MWTPVDEHPMTHPRRAIRGGADVNTTARVTESSSSAGEGTQPHRVRVTPTVQAPASRLSRLEPVELDRWGTVDDASELLRYFAADRAESPLHWRSCAVQSHCYLFDREIGIGFV